MYAMGYIHLHPMDEAVTTWHLFAAKCQALEIGASTDSLNDYMADVGGMLTHVHKGIPLAMNIPKRYYDWKRYRHPLPSTT